MNIKNDIISEIKKQWNSDLLGKLKQIDINPIKISENEVSTKVDRYSVTLMASSLSAAISTSKLIGQGKTVSASFLKNVKNQMDTSASYAFNDYRKSTYQKISISVSEGKDERGHIVDDPLKQTAHQEDSDFNVAVDVIDGTTLAAKGINGAYSISAGTKGLKSFPDMQAYAIGGPIEVVKQLDFYNKPENEVLHFISLLAEYYQKPIDKLKIVTHSYDTGMHHSQLIAVMEQLGVTVIVPEPVIVEPPYVASMALRGQDVPDGMIGVFGLPEIVINALLCINITNKQELRFRVASNYMLSKPERTNLGDAFSFTPDENHILEDYGINVKHVYSKADLAENYDNACFTAIALTDDPVLGFSGITHKENEFRIETLFSTKGNTMKITTVHEIEHPVSYTARQSQKIDDISVILPLADFDANRYLKKILEEMKSENFNFLKYSNSSDLHVTLYEYGIHYGGYSGDLQQAISQLVQHFSKCCNEEYIFELGSIDILGDSIVCRINLEPAGIKKVKCMSMSEEALSAFMNVNAMPTNLHITLARFVAYTEQSELDRLALFLRKIILPMQCEKFIIGKPQLVHIEMTPYNNVRVLA